MPLQEQYMPGPASGATVRKEGDKWTLILVRELNHAPEVVWDALTDPAQLREWAPFEADGDLGETGSRVKLTWSGTSQVVETTVSCAIPPQVLEISDMRFELEPALRGTRLTLWHKIDHRFVSWGAAGWHISLDVLASVLGGNPIHRIAGAEAMKLDGWKRLRDEYARLFGSESS